MSKPTQENTLGVFSCVGFLFLTAAITRTPVGSEAGANLEVNHEQSLSSPHAQDRIMVESAQSTASISYTEIMIRNLQAAGYSEDDIQYEMSGYGCAQTFARLLGDEQAAGACDPRQFSNAE